MQFPSPWCPFERAFLVQSLQRCRREEFPFAILVPEPITGHLGTAASHCPIPRQPISAVENKKTLRRPCIRRSLAQADAPRTVPLVENNSVSVKRDKRGSCSIGSLAEAEYRCLHVMTTSAAPHRVKWLDNPPWCFRAPLRPPRSFRLRCWGRGRVAR